MVQNSGINLSFHCDLARLFLFTMGCMAISNNISRGEVFFGIAFIIVIAVISLVDGLKINRKIKIAITALMGAFFNQFYSRFNIIFK